MKLINSIKKDFNTTTFILIPLALVINIIIGQIVILLGLPIYLDSIGTILVSILCGPWAGALTGALSNFIWGWFIDPNTLSWFPVSMFIGFAAGWSAVGGLFRTATKSALAGFLVALTGVVVSSSIAVYLYGGITASRISFITAFLLQTSRNVISLLVSTNFLVELVDKIAVVLLAFAFIKGLSAKIVSCFPRAENISSVNASLSAFVTSLTILMTIR